MTTTVNTDVPAYIVDGVLTDGEAWVALSTTVLTGDANSVTLTSSTGANDWSQYMDLIIIMNTNIDYSGASANYNIKARFNDDAGGSNTYPFQRYYDSGSGSAHAQYYGTYDGAYISNGISDGVGADEFGGSITRIADINSGKWKTVMSHMACATSNASYQDITVCGVFWKNTAAINKIQIYADVGGTYNFVADSRFDLFGTLPRMVS